MKTRIFAALVVVGVGLSGVAIAEEAFTPPKISAWDGKAWGSLQLGQTTQEGVKRDFKDGRGEFRNSVELKIEPEPAYRLNALFPSVDKNAKLNGLVIRYKNDSDGLPIADLSQALGEEAKTRYVSPRYDDWQVVAWPKRGILALAMDGKASWVLLGEPGKVAAVFSSVSATEPTTVGEVPDPGKGKDKEIVYGDVDVSFSLTRIDLDRKDRERDNLESDLRRAGDGRGRTPLRYERGVEGQYSLTISARSHDDKEGDGSVSAHISGRTPYGKIDVYDSESFKVEKGRKHLEDTSYYRAVSQAQRNVEEKALRELEKQGPPSADTVRRDQWTRLIEDYRNTKAGNAGGGLL